MAKSNLRKNRNLRAVKGGKEKKFSNNKIKKWVFFSIAGILMLSILFHGINYFRDAITARMLKFEIVELTSTHEGIYGTGFYIREEVVIPGATNISPEDIPPLTRVRKGQELSSSITAPISGLVMHFTDGYESYEPELSSSLVTVFNQYHEGLEQEVSTRDNGLKIVNNYKTDIMVRVTRENGNALKNSLSQSNSSRVRVRLGDEEFTQILWVNVREIEEYDQYYIIHLSSDEIKDNLVELRFSDVFFILETVTGIKLPSEVLVRQQDKVGVYSLSRNRVVFREVAVVKEEEGYVWLIGLRNNQEVILNPSIVSEGQIIKF